MSFFEGGVVLGVGSDQLFVEMFAQCLLVDLVKGDGDAVIEASGTDVVLAKVVGDVGQVATDEGLAVENGFEEGEAKAFRDGGGDEVSGVGEPALVVVGGSFEGGDFAGDVEEHREFVLAREVLPSLVDALPLWILGSQREGEPGIGGGERGEKKDFSKIFAANTANGVEDGLLLAGRGGSCFVWRSNDGVGKKVSLCCRDSGFF